MIEARVLDFVLVLVRLTGFTIFFPVFNSGQIPRLVKIGLAVSLTWALLGRGPTALLASGINPLDLNWVQAVVLVASEILFGAGLGFAFGILIEPARIAGAFIGQELGLTMASLADPTTRQPTNVVSQLFEAWAWILFFLLDIHHVLLTVLEGTLRLFPVGQALLVLPAPAAACEVDLISRWGLIIASPVGICLFILMVVLGILMRSVPQMNIFALGLALRLAVGIMAMAAFMPTMLRMLIRVLQHAEDVVPGLWMLN